jgi:hypothetical protein
MKGVEENIENAFLNMTAETETVMEKEKICIYFTDMCTHTHTHSELKKDHPQNEKANENLEKHYCICHG